MPFQMNRMIKHELHYDLYYFFIFIVQHTMDSEYTRAKVDVPQVLRITMYNIPVNR